MISTHGKKIFFINPPESLKNEFLEYIFNNEFELYLLDNWKKIPRLLNIFQDSILFINIDKGMSRIEWAEYIAKVNKKFNKTVIAVFSANESQVQQKIYLMDIGIKGGYIHIKEDNWKTIEIINRVLEINEARGRRKSVRLDFNNKGANEDLFAKIFTMKGYMLTGHIESMSSAGLLVSVKKGKIDSEDNVESVIFKIRENELRVKGYLLKRFDNGNYFISFEDVNEHDKAFVHKYIF